MGVRDANRVNMGGFVGGSGEGCVEEGEREGIVVAAGYYQGSCF